MQPLLLRHAIMRNSDTCRSHCPINFALETFGDRWTLLIIRDLMFKNKSTFSAMRSSDEKIATNILADRLKRLEAHGLIEKSVNPDNRSSVVYALTEMGRDLVPVMLEITAWSVKYDAQTNAPKTFLEDFEAARDEMIAAAKAHLTKD